MTKRKVIVWGGFGEKNSNSGRQYYLQNRIYDAKGISPALSAYKSDYWIIIEEEDTKNNNKNTKKQQQHIDQNTTKTPKNNNNKEKQTNTK